jgi:hypothetical protein
VESGTRPKVVSHFARVSVPLPRRSVLTSKPSATAPTTPRANAVARDRSPPASESSRMHFLVIDDRFRVPIFVFLELDPRESGVDCVGVVRVVTLEAAAARSGGTPRRTGDSFRAQATIGRDPNQPDRYVEFPSDGHVRAAGFAVIEPRYVGPSWETYLNVFRPEGEKQFKQAAARSVLQHGLVASTRPRTSQLPKLRSFRGAPAKPEGA